VGCRRRNGEGRGSWVFALSVVGCRRRNREGRGSWVFTLSVVGCRQQNWEGGCGLSPIVLVGTGLGEGKRGENGRVWAGGERKKMEVR
jgi:hypothetical protein